MRLKMEMVAPRVGVAGTRWFEKWQALSAQERSDFLWYVERTIKAKELMMDEVDNFVRVWASPRTAPTMAPTTTT